MNAAARPLKLRRTWRSLLLSRAVLTCVVFLAVLLPLAAALYTQALAGTRLYTLYLLALGAPLLGAAVAFVMLCVVLYQRSRPLLVIDKFVTLSASRVRFPVSELSHVQLYSLPGEGSFLALLPAYVSERVPDEWESIAEYTVAFPAQPNFAPYELLGHIRQRAPQITADKLGTIRI